MHRTPKPGDLYRADANSGTGLFAASDLLPIYGIRRGRWLQFKFGKHIVEIGTCVDNLEMVNGAWQRRGTK